MFWAGKPTGKHLHSTKVASFSTCQKMWPCRFEWQVWHFVTFHVCEVQDIARLSWGWSCRAYGKSCTNVSFRRVRRCAHVVLRGRRGALRHSTCVRFCEVQDCREAEVTVPMGKVAQTCRLRRVTRCGHVVLRGTRGTWWHSTCVRCATVVKLKLPCLWQKSHKRVFCDVSEDVAMSFWMAGVALCGIPRVWGARLSWGWSVQPIWDHSCHHCWFAPPHPSLSFLAVRSCSLEKSNCEQEKDILALHCRPICVWDILFLDSRMRSEGFSFYIWGSGGGVWGLTRVRVTLLLASATVCNRPQTVCNRPQPSVCGRRGRKVAVPMGKVAQTWLFFDESQDVLISFEARKLPCLSEKSQKCVFLDVPQDVFMLFCEAGVALCDIPRVWGARPLWG